jgi:pimeloyl-ACP methyl ester carboxylesterase
MRHPGKTPPFCGPRGKPVPGSIAEIRYLRIGGIDQWTLIRGERATNPPLVLLHGGPGMSETSFFRVCNASLEESFTVVYWDQRGTGKSYNRRIPGASMTVEQFVSDLDELVTYVRTRIGATKVSLFGHSWGSALGVLYAARFPQKVAVYVGSGQYGDWAAAEAASYAFALAEAQRRTNRKALQQLRAIGPPPYGARQLLKERTWIQQLRRPALSEGAVDHGTPVAGRT